MPREPLKLLSIIIPARDECAGITSTVEHLQAELEKNEVPHEIIVVDDGSNDDTMSVLRKLVSRIRELTEDAKIAVRNVRRDGNKSADQEQKAKALTEDDRDKVKQEIQDLTKKFESKATDLAAAKEKEVMED